MVKDLKVVYTAGNLQEAHFLRNVLEEGGIPAIVTNVDLEGRATPDLWGREWTSLPRVVVHEENAAAAREIAMDFDRTIVPRAKAAGEEEAAEGTADKAEPPAETSVHAAALGASWPRCGSCGAPRITRCAACGTSGTGFPPADVQPDPPSPRPLLLCIQCDEPFTPEYARNCEWCGHEFPDGFRPPEPSQIDEFSPALLAFAAITIVIAVGLIAYFALLVR